MHTHHGSRANSHCQVLIHHAGFYGKQHANGILEIFRRTTLPASGIPAWKPVHKIASRLSRSAEGAGLERDLVALVDDLSTTIASADGKGPMDVSGAISDWYWRVTLLLVLGTCLLASPRTIAMPGKRASSAWDRRSSTGCERISTYRRPQTCGIASLPGASGGR